MSLHTLEVAIWREAQTVLKNLKIRLKDLAEWSTGELDYHEGEVNVFLPTLKVFVAFPTACDKRNPKPAKPKKRTFRKGGVPANF